MNHIEMCRYLTRDDQPHTRCQCWCHDEEQAAMTTDEARAALRHALRAATTSGHFRALDAALDKHLPPVEAAVRAEYEAKLREAVWTADKLYHCEDCRRQMLVVLNDALDATEVER